MSPYESLSSDEQRLVDDFFYKFPPKGRAGEEIAFLAGGEKVLKFIIHFRLATNRMKFLGTRSEEIVAVPYAYFLGYFHPEFPNCLSSVRTGSPNDPMYKCSYEIPAQREMTMRSAFQAGKIPCPKCYGAKLEIIQ